MSAPGYPMPASQPYAAQAPAHDPTAVMGARVVAGVVDVLLYALLAAFVLLATPLNPLAEYDDNPQDLSQADACEILQDRQDAVQCFLVGDKVYWTDDDDLPIQIGAWLAFFGGYVLLQGVTGFSPGKLLLGLRVVREDGQIAGIGKSLVRSLLWVVDGLPGIFLVGFICALTSTGHRRVGDMAAKTFVVRKGDVGRPMVVPGMAMVATPGMPGGYGTPTVYPSAPPYVSPGAPPTAPGAPGAWGAPPSQPGVGVPGAPGAPGGPVGPTTGQQPAVWGAPPPPAAPAPPAPPAPAPGPSDTARFDVPFGAGAAPTGGVPADSPADVTLVSGGPQGAEDPTVVGGPPPGSDDPTSTGSPAGPVIEAGQSPAAYAARSGEQAAAGDQAGDQAATEPSSGETPAAELSPAEAPEAPSRWLATPSSPAPSSPATDAPSGETPVPADEETTEETPVEDTGAGDDPNVTGATEVITVGDVPPSGEDTPADAETAPGADEPTATPGDAGDDDTDPGTGEAIAPAADAGSAEQQGGRESGSPYKPQWDAARAAYIQWDPNRSRWLQWDDTAKEWNPI